MSWVTVVWSMVGSASLTLAAIHSLVWLRNREAWAYLLFSLTAVSLSAFAFCELWTMRAATPGELLLAARWGQVPLFFFLVSLVWFVATYLQAGRLWLGWIGTGIRVVFVLVNVLGNQNLNFKEITSLRHARFLGESVTVLVGVPNPVMLFGEFGVVLLLVFIADASVTAWRRGERRKALTVGGSATFFLLGGLGTSVAVIWAHVEAPILFSLLYLGLAAVMGYELSTDVLRSAQLAHDLQATNQQISDLFGRLISAQETERTRIARDLHDDVSQRIAALSIMISGVKRSLSGKSGGNDVMDVLTSMQQGTAALAEEIRHLSHDLHPGLLQHTGLVTALAAFCAQFQKLQAIEVTYTADADLSQLEAGLALCLYRIAQEALGNVAKHSGARHVGVTLTRTADGVQLSIVDDGKGFDLAQKRGRGAGLGLVSIDERARLLRGTVRLETQPQNGTRLHVQIPWPSGMTPIDAACS